jgi:AbrB family looped-hinge helix DNA binding protein
MGAQSKLTAQGQISVPAEVRRKLGVGPGSILEWEEREGEFVVRRGGSFNSAQIHDALFADGPPDRRIPADAHEGVRAYIRKRHASG